MLERYSNNQLLYQAVLPDLNDGILDDYINLLSNDFERVLAQYDDHVGGLLNFDYCDTVARFYLRVWARTDSITIRKMLLTRLVRMGASHNRFFVGQVVGGLLPQITETSEVMMAADVLTTYRGDIDFFRPYVENVALARPIDDVFRDGSEPSDDDDDDEPW